ncbi:hypothetical protein [Streptomyces stelliscabiei]|uniref:hypothetical protein n=1 Tax=Streptomyces stelliscabiei TaxID=146820 RepID=UPI002FF1A887
MNSVQQLAYRRIPSFKRESGGLYRLYAAVYSRAYAARMRYLHKRGRHGHGAPHSIAPRCQWCGAFIT